MKRPKRRRKLYTQGDVNRLKKQFAWLLHVSQDSWMKETDTRKQLVSALQDLLHFHDRLAGECPHESGWSAKDVLRLKEIRRLAKT